MKAVVKVGGKASKKEGSSVIAYMIEGEDVEDEAAVGSVSWVGPSASVLQYVAGYAALRRLEEIGVQELELHAPNKTFIKLIEGKDGAIIKGWPETGLMGGWITYWMHEHFASGKAVYTKAADMPEVAALLTKGVQSDQQSFDI